MAYEAPEIRRLGTIAELTKFEEKVVDYILGHEHPNGSVAGAT